MSGTNITTYPSQMMPNKGVPLGASYTAKTATGGPDNLDITSLLQNRRIDQIQAVYIDNSGGSEPFVLQVVGGINITAPAQSQGWYPCPVAVPSLSSQFIFSGASADVDLLFLNVPMPIGQWGTVIGGGGSGGTVVVSGGTIDIGEQPILAAVVNTPLPIDGNNPNAVLTSPYGATPSNPNAFAIANGGTAVSALTTCNAGGYIHNPGTATESLWIDLVNTAATSEPGPNGTTTELLVGQTFNVPPMRGAVSVNGLTTGHSFSAVQFTSE